MKYHYVYRITNKFLNKHYYGIRTSSILPINDLGVKYFSSSRDKDFIKDQKDNPQHFKYKIIKNCKNRLQALELEIKLHGKFNVGMNESFYNLAKQTSTGYDTQGIKLTEKQLMKRRELRGKRKCSEETKKRISDALTGKKHNQERRKINSEVHKGITHSEETKKKISELTSGENNGFYGKNHSEETRRKISEGQKGKPKIREKVKCPHCEKIGDQSLMTRWHFNNCKMKG